MKEIIIDKEYLLNHPDEIFVFGDNLLRVGYGGAAALRDEVNSYGFITKKAPGNDNSDYYKPEEYEKVFYQEILKLQKMIEDHPEYTYLISKLGGGLANKFEIFEKVVSPKIRRFLGHYKNVKFLWDEEKELEKDWWGYVDQRNNINVFEYNSIERTSFNKTINTDPAMEVAENNPYVQKVFGPFKAKNKDQIKEKIKIIWES